MSDLEVTASILAVISFVFIFKQLTIINDGFDKRALKFYILFSSNEVNSKSEISFKDVFFMTLEDYLKRYYLLLPHRKSSVRNYLVEHFDNISNNQESNLQELIKEVLIGNFMHKKSYASGQSWVLVSEYKLDFLKTAAQGAVLRAYKNAKHLSS
ncbi:hypothetical protein [Hymenobacter aerophilus]|uniref:hypothetical protein n=1 Tax=Hymenobacter aerophilus TaxID=119644 RepID=UPI0012FA3B7D|nr:hypothetical protein [Hymenobacter aerophilus]